MRGLPGGSDSNEFACSIRTQTWHCMSIVLPSGSDGKESALNAGDQGLIPGSGRSPGEENDNLLQYSCLENSMDRGAWWTTIHGVTKELDTT